MWFPVSKGFLFFPMALHVHMSLHMHVSSKQCAKPSTTKSEPCTARSSPCMALKLVFLGSRDFRSKSATGSRAPKHAPAQLGEFLAIFCWPKLLDLGARNPGAQGKDAKVWEAVKSATAQSAAKGKLDRTDVMSADWGTSLIKNALSSVNNGCRLNHLPTAFKSTVDQTQTTLAISLGFCLAIEFLTKKSCHSVGAKTVSQATRAATAHHAELPFHQRQLQPENPCHGHCWGPKPCGFWCFHVLYVSMPFSNMFHENRILFQVFALACICPPFVISLQFFTVGLEWSHQASRKVAAWKSAKSVRLVDCWTVWIQKFRFVRMQKSSDKKPWGYWHWASSDDH